MAHTLSSIYAPHEHAEHVCHRVLPMACAGSLMVDDIRGDVGATRRNSRAHNNKKSSRGYEGGSLYFE